MNPITNIVALENGTEVLRAIAHPIRMAMIILLHEQKQLSVTEIHEALNIEQAIASHHLRILKDRDVVKSTRDGKNILYVLKSDGFYDVVRIITEQI